MRCECTVMMERNKILHTLVNNDLRKIQSKKAPSSCTQCSAAQQDLSRTWRGESIHRRNFLRTTLVGSSVMFFSSVKTFESHDLFSCLISNCCFDFRPISTLISTVVLDFVEICVVRLGKFVWERCSGRNLGGRTRNQNCKTLVWVFNKEAHKTWGLKQSFMWIFTLRPRQDKLSIYEF